MVPKKPTITGPDLALTVPTPQGGSLDLSYWDLWFALVAVRMHDGDLRRLAARLKDDRSIFYSRDSTERKRWHLRDLMRRLDGASVTPGRSSKPPVPWARRRSTGHRRR